MVEQKPDRTACTTCGHDDLTHAARLALGVPGGLIYGECFAQALGYPQCPCPKYQPKGTAE